MYRIVRLENTIGKRMKRLLPGMRRGRWRVVDVVIVEMVSEVHGPMSK